MLVGNKNKGWTCWFLTERLNFLFKFSPIIGKKWLKSFTSFWLIFCTFSRSFTIRFLINWKNFLFDFAACFSIFYDKIVSFLLSPYVWLFYVFLGTFHWPQLFLISYFLWTSNSFFEVSLLNWLSTQLWWFLFFTTSLGRYLSKIDISKVWGSSNLSSIVLYFSQLSRFDFLWLRTKFIFFKKWDIFKFFASFLKWCIQVCFLSVFLSENQGKQNNDQIYMFFLNF